MVTDDPLAYLRATLDVVQAEALAAQAETGDGRWRRGDGAIHAEAAGEELILGPWGHLDESLGKHLVRHDPAAVLRRIAADRKLVDGLAKIIDGEFIDDGEVPLAEWALERLAEGYGWTEETP